MNTTYYNAVANAGAGLITHIGIVDGSGNEISGSGYARQAVTWTSASNGTIRPNANRTFTMPEGSQAGGWAGFSALTGGINYGHEFFRDGSGNPIVEQYPNGGELVLIASQTGINHESKDD